MPATTRSGARQARIDDPTETKAAVTGSKRKATSQDGQPRKRTAKPTKQEPDSEPSHASPGAKSQTKQHEPKSNDAEDSIVMNRAPVLELWAACVTSFLYPEISWETSLSAGSAISTLCAISKGRAIGTIEKPDPAAAEKKREERQQRSKRDELDELEVMGFHLKLKEGQALVGDKPKKANEAALVKKFGEEAYEKTKHAFEEALKSWSGQEEGLNAQAFHHYEDFRPTVPKGQKGWGRKGMLNLNAVRDAVSSG